MDFRMELSHRVHLVTSRETLNRMFLGNWIVSINCCVLPPQSLVLVARRNERRGIFGFIFHG